MVKVNIISGFLGAGKTTLIKKLISGAMKGEKVILLDIISCCVKQDTHPCPCVKARA
jgi:predicted ATPase